MMPDQDPRPARTLAAERGAPLLPPLPAGVSELERTVIAAAAASHRAWVLLTTRYDARVRRTARLYGLAPHDVDDVAQATWLCLFEHIDTLRSPNGVGAWLETAAHRESLRLLRRSRREEPLGAELAERMVVEPVDERRLVADEQRRALDEAVRRLPEHQRALLAMMLCEPAARYSEIARRLGMPRGSIGPTRQRGLSRLRTSESLAALCSD